MREDQSGCALLVGPTSDGGAHFGPLSLVTTCGANGPPASDLAFNDHGDGFVYNPGLFFTFDGGELWVPAPQPGIVLSVEALGYSVWMLEADCPAAATQACTLRLFESADGGISWAAPRNQPELPPGPFAAGVGGQTWLVRTGPSSGYVVSSPAQNPLGAPDVATLAVTDNGGRSWSTEQLPCGFDAQSVAMSAAPDGSLLAICAGEPGAGNQIKSVARSFDGGSTWFVNVPQFPGPQGGEVPLDFGYLGEVDAVSSTTAYAIGDRSPLLVTHDGGADWQVADIQGDTAGGYAQVIFFEPSEGLVFGDDLIWSTADGGVSWSEVAPSP